MGVWGPGFWGLGGQHFAMYDFDCYILEVRSNEGMNKKSERTKRRKEFY